VDYFYSSPHIKIYNVTNETDQVTMNYKEKLFLYVYFCLILVIRFNNYLFIQRDKFSFKKCLYLLFKLSFY